MNRGLVIRYTGLVILLNAFFMLISAGIALADGFDTGFYPLLLSFIITAIIGSFPLIFVPKQNQITTKESYIIVLTSWGASCLLGMVPYVIWGGEFDLINSWFESVSGFTTTGGTILDDVEALPKSLLFWRASTHWIGGVGVVLFALLILPSMGRSKMSLTSAEMSTLAKDNFHYNTRKVLRIILVVYTGITVVETGCLMLFGMHWFDAVTTAFSTVATGGFSIRNASIMYYHSFAIEMVVATFMVVSGMHMGLIYATLQGRRNNLFRSEVARFYLISLAVCTLIVSASLLSEHHYNTPGEALRYGFFQVASYTTTSGFASADNALWPPLAIVVLMYCMIQCAMAGSSTGGIKVDRVLLLLKAIRARAVKLQHPNAIIRIKLNGIAQDDSLVNAAMLMILFFLATALAGTVLLAAMGVDLMTGFSASISCLSNVGPGFGKLSNLENFSIFSPAAKVLLSFLMLFGRLELFGFIHLFMLRSWK